MITRLRGWLQVAVWASSLAGCIEGGPTGDRSAASTVSSAPRPGAGGSSAGGVARAGGADGAPSGPVASGAAPGLATAVAEVAPPSTSGRPLAVILLMPPRDPKDGDRPGGPLVFKVSLTADARTATIEMDGHAVGSTPVQRFYAGEGEPRAPARGTSSRAGFGRPTSPWSTPVGPGSGFPPAAPVPVDDSRRAILPAAILTPNGAPIID